MVTKDLRWHTNPRRRRYLQKYRKKYDIVNKKNLKKKADIWVKNNPEKRREIGIRHRLKKQGVSKIEIEKAIQAGRNPNKVCSVCGVQCTKPKQWHTDHDHVSLLFRGIVCFNCNTMLGSARDSIKILKRAILYLKKFRRIARRLSKTNRRTTC